LIPPRRPRPDQRTLEPRSDGKPETPGCHTCYQPDRPTRSTNQIESLNSVVRKAVRIRGHFPDDDSARKLVYLAIRNHESNWKRPMAGWYECLAAFHAHFEDRLTRHN